MLKLIVCALCFGAAIAHDFKTCGTDNLGITSVTVTPDSPIPGQNLTVSFTGTPTQDVVDGDTITITVKVFGVALGHVDFNACKDIGLTCPLKAGTASKWAATYLVPSAAPGGVPLTAEFTAKTAAASQYSCVDVDVVMGKPPAPTPEFLQLYSAGASCLHHEDKSDMAHRKCYEACGLGNFKVTGLTTAGKCPDEYTQTDSTKTVEACSDGVTNLKYCSGKGLNKVQLRESTKGIKGVCYHATEGNKCYEGCAMTEFKMTGLSKDGSCDASFTVTEKTDYVMSCSDGKTNTKYCFHPLYLVNVTMKTKGQKGDQDKPLLVSMVETAADILAGHPRSGEDTTLYKISGDECGEATLDSKYATYAEKFAGLKEGTCASQGYTKADGTQTLKVPVLGDITISKFTKPSEVGKATNCMHHEDAANSKCYDACSKKSGSFSVKGMDKMGPCPSKYDEVDTRKTVKQCSDGVTNLKYCSGGNLFPVTLLETTRGISAPDAHVVIPFAEYATARANAECTKDADCPSSYCQNGFCHGCFDKCCETDSDCTKKGLSYCAKDSTKMPPYFCHA